MKKASNGKSLFNEMTRVQMPALVHLTRLGYTYYGRIFEDMAGTVYDPDTNILKDVFLTQFKKLNPEHEGEAEQVLKTIIQELSFDDLGKSFYSRLKSTSPIRLIDFDKRSVLIFHRPAAALCALQHLKNMKKSPEATHFQIAQNAELLFYDDAITLVLSHGIF